MKHRAIGIFFDSKGASAVEFAIVLPLLLVFLFGIIEFSIMFYDKAVITNASREGARAGVVFSEPRITTTHIQNVVDNYTTERLITFGSSTIANNPSGYNCQDVDELKICVSPPNACSNPGEELTVLVGYKYDFLVIDSLLGLLNTGSGGGTFGNASTIGAKTKMVCE